MMPAAPALLAVFEAAADAASETEAALRKRMEAEVTAAERERAVAYRRLNLMRTLTRAISRAESAEAAVSSGLAAVRAQLGWESDSDTRSETLSRLGPVVSAAFAGLAAPAQDAQAPAVDVAGTLAEFEAWYERAYARSFWALFEQEIAELPLVER